MSAQLWEEGHRRPWGQQEVSPSTREASLEEVDDPISAFVVCFPFLLLVWASFQDELMGKPVFNYKGLCKACFSEHVTSPSPDGGLLNAPSAPQPGHRTSLLTAPISQAVSFPPTLRIRKSACVATGVCAVIRVCLPIPGGSSLLCCPAPSQRLERSCVCPERGAELTLNRSSEQPSS